MTTELSRVTGVVVNYRTRDLTRRAAETLLHHYPQLRLIVIDNGSEDESTGFVRELGQTRVNVTAVLNRRNRYHGPALDQAIRSASTEFVFTLDSDCEIQRGGFLEAMLSAFADERVYAVGDIRYKNRFGFTYGYGEEAHPERPNRIPYVHPYAMLLRRSTYLQLHRFVHHGAPCLKNMRDAQRRGYVVVNFPVGDYVYHRLAGTSSGHGYGVVARTRNILEARANSLHGWLTRDPTVPVRVVPRQRPEDSDPPRSPH